MSSELPGDLIHDWNRVDAVPVPEGKRIEFDDETLRDGLQSPSVTNPPITKKIEILHLMESLGIHCADIGLPGAGPHAKKATLALAWEIVNNRMKILPDCACRTLKVDITPIIEISQEVGVPIEASTFIGSSPVRLYAEGWTVDTLLRHTEEAVTYAVENGLTVMYVTEDTIRALPETIDRLYTTAIECGARRICVCDTVGHATPDGVRALLAFVRGVVRKTGEDVKIDWHGHSDRGLGVINAIAALQAGADRVHGTALGIGERCGNAPLDQILLNLKLMGLIENDLTRLPEYCRVVSEATRVPIPVNYPAVGRDAFRTATGVHAAAVIKAAAKGQAALADQVYSGVPASLVGRGQMIEVGPMSGESNVVYWLTSHGYEPKPEWVKEVFRRAKLSARTLTDEEIRAALR